MPMARREVLFNPFRSLGVRFEFTTASSINALTSDSLERCTIESIVFSVGD